ncbi:cytochrome c-type biogenesis protein [Proteiniborus ethanoligenes]|uniref:Cytochrome c-type biogenesis protein n=1 Tax=Proteiniborus ethanoligenes TaxID=415015 RepID=A0A1H3M4J2_9FIRM|nr:cytochrome c biogenesis protein CcdA [Proteiniborus ethanoligenes]SDY71204.1 cytochrome c-type biogenesis protein [Proteiniborus ethanoligenes]
MTDISISAALIAGIVSFFSPCVLPLIPAYITYITDTALEEELEDRKLLALSRTLGFVLGFTIIFMIMGVSASFIGRLFRVYKTQFLKISGILIIGLGLNMIGVLNLNFLSKGGKIKMPRITSWFSSVLVGMAFAAGWTPCAGAVLGTILILAGSTGTVTTGVLLLLAYSIGLAIPFILTALLISKFGRFLAKSEKVLPYINKIGGIIVIALGLLMFFNKIYLIANIFL